MEISKYALTTTETPYLNRKEIRSGVHLACQVKIREDIYVRIPADYLNVRMFTSMVASSVDLTYDIKESILCLDEAAEISHRPGQYVQVQAPCPEGPVFRAYSISSPVYEPNIIQLVVRLVPGGIASMRNIIYTLYHHWPDRVCWLFFGCRATKDIFYLDELKELERKHDNFHVIYALSDRFGPDEQWDGETGFIHLSVDKYLEPAVGRQAFLCGAWRSFLGAKTSSAVILTGWLSKTTTLSFISKASAFGSFKILC